MTSSLVGSEMCIRDSVSRTSGVELAVGAVAAPAEGPRQATWRLTGYWPVSYTHLTLPTICSV
eukprot:9384917-Prorocentrum_lima.AAC.1